MTTHIAGTFYVPENQTVTVRLPALREGNDESRVLLFHNRGEVYVPAYIEEADTDDLLLLNQYNADALVEAVRARVDVLEDFDPSTGHWTLTRTGAGLDVEHHRGPETAADAMGGDDAD